ncbi:MAG: S41 family peptidase [Thermoanaerobaculia bacterium]|nr:S41 family peptidase [Thermoanaerobaculia bacterium]
MPLSRSSGARRTTRLARRAAAWSALWLLALLPAVDVRLGAAERDDGEGSLYRNLSIFSEVLSLVRRTYVDEPDVGALFAGSLDGITDGLDPLADFVPASGVAAFRRAQEIGAGRSGVRLARDRGILYVLAVERGGPGAAAGLARSDIVTAVDGEDTRGMALWQIRGRLAGEPGSRLELELIRRGQARTASLTLAEWQAPNTAVEVRDGIPVLRVGRFDEATVPAVRGRLEELASSGGRELIVDLRGVAGGDAASAYAVAALFAPGELGRLVRRGETLRTFVGESPALWSGRVVVATSRASQGAAEILAAVLAQRAGAELVGERTFGHAGRESVRELSTGDLLVLTDAFYTGPDGELLDRGREPDVVVREAERRFAESELPLEDLILERALERVRSSGGGAPRIGAGP